eukprot:TRINITY_DN69102_c0_g1_i1.p1 TRINITY_DN69102_c0_g1~~TRINITY_DN69102_c0_g1_i1.p1  ORF type:complete len:177 (+),score=20.62 TRINITY_DN69102_c0_g1_i1:112-642(+)
MAPSMLNVLFVAIPLSRERAWGLRVDDEYRPDAGKPRKHGATSDYDDQDTEPTLVPPQEMIAAEHAFLEAERAIGDFVHLVKELPHQFVANFDRRHGQRLGVNVSSTNDGRSLSVDTEPIPGSLVAMWNEQNPDMHVYTGSHVVQVNQISGDPILMAQELLQARSINVTFQLESGQ